MDIHTFFTSSAFRLPRQRTPGDFRQFLQEVLRNYLHAIDNLDDTCHVCRMVKAEKRGDSVSCSAHRDCGR